jgi:hypothetical protein
MVNLDVSLEIYTCRWCGGAYGVTKAMADNPNVEKRCQLGHSYSDKRTFDERLADAHRVLADTEDRERAAKASIANLKGQITKLQGRLRALRGE